MSNPTESFSQTTALYASARVPLWSHCAAEHDLHLLESEAFELWLVATASCREEIRRLERLLRAKEEISQTINKPTETKQ